jgi:ribose transport system ATP-binding protein
LISSYLPEVLGLSDRVLVMAQGRIAGELSAEQATQDSVMALAVSTPSTPTQATTAVEGHRGH